MSILKVARIGTPVLREIADPVPERALGSPEFERLIDDMIETMHEYDGIGLAAPQVHASTRIVVIEVPISEENEEDAEAPLTVLVNPIVTPVGERRVLGWEGCLSLPEMRGQVIRWDQIHLDAQDRHGNAIDADYSGFFARVIQHECDHLDGVLYVDRMEGMRSLCFVPEFDRFVADDEDVPCA
jgi:peptide deformylase